ncbi:nucleotidyl transferase AbiEii/AbiGii toxin family protein [Aquirufa antheringensis]|uniref:nucleotidyl transferase AbiEii/AbiGii toxin family protein n=1 Tax=Aquirufa antheringensis TaxID=2516559 RepID=UPI0022A93615|nr:nucleotidyl transferase AbiEii/AbiGii toxin family protein [Aquirufa antheringensis]MCZ2484721.1 nucleotidyl transferase AbiEii/AbiGii toxin family protein [Aquirufa antheringensis]
MIKEWIESYEPKNIQDTEQALREIMQEIALAGLYRANFFKHAAFYGGTALRIFHGLNRFSEDLDFSLLQKDADFEFDHYFKSIVDEFQALGIKVSLNQKMKSTISTIDSAFLKSDTLWSELIFEDTIPQIKLSIKPSIKIKLEIDTNPPLRFGTENKLLTKPFSFYVNCLTLPDLFAGKMLALLFRKWKTRVKGREWAQEIMTKDQLLELLALKIASLDINRVKEDVIRFIPNPQDLEIWSQGYFQQICDRLEVS